MILQIGAGVDKSEGKRSGYNSADWFSSLAINDIYLFARHMKYPAVG